MSEFRAYIPFADQVAEILYHRGEFSHDLTEQGLSDIMQDTIAGIVSANGYEENVSGTPLDVRMNNYLGSVAGLLFVQHPLVSAQIDMGLTLANSQIPDRLMVYGNPLLDVKAEGFGAGILRNKVSDGFNRFLADPGQALYEQFHNQLQQRHVKLTSMGLRMNERTLGVRLTGQPLPPQW